MPVERCWWEDLEAGQSAAVSGSDASHWVAVYSDLIRTMKRMEVEASVDRSLAERLARRLREAEARHMHWLAKRKPGG